MVHFPLNYIRCAEFNTNLLHNAFYLFINALTCFGPKRRYIFRELVYFLACAASASTYTVRILHIVVIIIIKFYKSGYGYYG